MAGENTREGLLDKRPDVARDELPFGHKPSSGIHGDRTVNTYGSLHNIEKGRTIESGTQEGAGALPKGVVQPAAISRPSVGTLPAWNGGAGAPKSGPGSTSLSVSSDDRQDDATADAGSESNEVLGAGSQTSATSRKASADGTDTTSGTTTDQSTTKAATGTVKTKGTSAAKTAKNTAEAETGKS